MVSAVFTHRRSGRRLKAVPQRTQMWKSVRIAARDWMANERTPAQAPVPYLTRDEVERFFHAIPQSNPRDRLLFDLIYRHGLRRGEAAQLTLDDVRGGKIWIARLKRGVPGGYPLHPRSKQLLRAYLPVRPADPCDYLFRGRRRTAAPLSGGEINRLFRQYATTAQLPERRRHLHVLRHSIGVHLRNAAWDIADVQDWLGHRHISSTMIYAQITNQRREARYKATERSREIARTDGR